MLRTFGRISGWILVVWGVATWTIWIINVSMGIAPPEKLITAGICGGILVGIGYWLMGKTERKNHRRESYRNQSGREIDRWQD